MEQPQQQPFSEAEWEGFEKELLTRAKEIARRLANGVRRLTSDDQRGGPDDSSGDVPAFG